jgi:hypothetical protein
MVMEVLLEVEVKKVEVKKFDPYRQNCVSIFSIPRGEENWAGRCNFNSVAATRRHRSVAGENVNGTYCA